MNQRPFGISPGAWDDLANAMGYGRRNRAVEPNQGTTLTDLKHYQQRSGKAAYNLYLERDGQHGSAPLKIGKAGRN